MHPPLLLILHGTAGGVTLLAGTAAMIVRKGAKRHSSTGNVFAASMIVLGTSGVILAAIKSQSGNVLGGLLTVYMVYTAWSAARSANGRNGVLDWIAAALGLGTGIAITWYGVLVARGLLGTGVPAGMDFFLGSVVLLAVAGDAHMLLAGGITGRKRIVRHLWRMCFALFEASGSFFMGRQRLFPEWVQHSGLLILLTILPLLLIIFWVVRVRNPGAWRPILRSAD